MRTMHLFAGAGGGLLADLILGHTPVVAVEWEPYPCQVLRERAAEGWFPELVVWEGDVRDFDPSEYAGSVDCIHAGFPCQDISTAGKQAGVGEGTRSGLYREVLRIAGAVRPRYIFLENVAAIKSNGLETVVKDLALLGYDTRWLCIRASDVGAPHHRDRWFALCHADTNSGDGSTEQTGKHQRAEKSGGDCAGEVGSLVADTLRKGLEGQRQVTLGIKEEHAIIGNADWWKTEPAVGRVVDGLSGRLDRLKQLGNAVVPQIPELIGRAIMEFENANS